MSHKGSCVCGKLTYEFEGDPAALAACHCIPCRKTSSNSHSSNFMVPKNKLKVHGSTRKFTRKGDSGGDVTYNYCEVCPTVVYVDIDSMKDVYVVKAGTSDDLDLLHNKKYDAEIFTKYRYPFLKPIEGAAQNAAQ